MVQELGINCLTPDQLAGEPFKVFPKDTGYFNEVIRVAKLESGQTSPPLKLFY